MSYDEQLSAMKGYADLPADQIPGAQGSPEWLANRVGHITASRFKDACDMTKAGKESAKRSLYRRELIVERLTGRPTEHFVSKSMETGTDREPLARMAYEAATGNMVDQVGFIHHTAHKWIGGSPDGLVGDDGMIEIKCPTGTTHVDTLLGAPCDYLDQIQGLLWITGRQWCDYVSFNPDFPADLQIRITRIMRDDDYIAELAAAILKLADEVAAQVTQLTGNL